MARGGYAWWYLDALSDDGREALVAIAFVGSVFSPYYAWARARAPHGAADPLQHNAINLSLYRPGGGKRWTMTERGRDALQRSPQTLQIGPSSWRWVGDALVLELDEVTAPWPRRIRGTVRLFPLALHGRRHALDEPGLHRWWPIAPRARVEVSLSEPQLRWQGHGYLDTNDGDAPLEDGFRHWHWSRAALPGGDAAVLYDAWRRDGSRATLALRFGRHGESETFAAPPPADLPASRWGIGRTTRSDASAAAQVQRTLEDGPFYARSLVNARWAGQPVRAMHESLQLDRFARRWVQAMLPFRMPRRPG